MIWQFAICPLTLVFLVLEGRHFISLSLVKNLSGCHSITCKIYYLFSLSNPSSHSLCAQSKLDFWIHWVFFFLFHICYCLWIFLFYFSFLFLFSLCCDRRICVWKRLKTLCVTFSLKFSIFDFMICRKRRPLFLLFGFCFFLFPFFFQEKEVFFSRSLTNNYKPFHSIL